MGSSMKWFRGIRGKLLFSAVMPVLAFGVVTYFTSNGVNLLGNLLERSNKDLAVSLDSLGRMNTEASNMGRFIWTIIGNRTNPDERTKLLKRVETAVADFQEAQKRFESTNITSEASEVYKPAKANSSRMIEITEKISNLLRKNTPQSDSQAIDVIVTEWRQFAYPVEDALEKIVDIYTGYVQTTYAEGKAAETKTLSTVLAISGVACLILFVLMLTLASRLAQAVGGVATKLSDSSTQVSTSSEQLSSAGQQLSSSSTEAAASLEETVSSLEELSSMVKLNADNAKEAAALSQTSKSSAEQGESEIKSLIESMTDISQSSKKIEEIINVIDDIAFQTNLLALNAAVEAARAGEQGKGFAVVAEAVRSLAQRSAAAAKDITTLIQDSVTKIDRGTKIADQSGSVLKNIVASVKKVADLNTEIASASQEQSTGISQISKAMNQLDQATQTNAASAEEVAASSEEMSSQSIALQNLVSELTTVVDGQSTLATGNLDTSEVAKKKPALRLASTTLTPRKTPVTQRHAEKVIPFESNEPIGKVGTIDGF